MTNSEYIELDSKIDTGAIVMEPLDLIIEPPSLCIYPNPRSILPMAEVE